MVAFEIVGTDDASMPAHAAEAFAVFVAGGGRSLARTAELMAVPAGTVRSWASRYHWQTRIREVDQQERKAAIEVATSAAASQHLANMAAAISIRDDPRAAASARMRAIEWLSGIGGLVPARTTDAAEDPGSDAGVWDYSSAQIHALAAAGETEVLLAQVRGQDPPRVTPSRE